MSKGAYVKHTPTQRSLKVFWHTNTPGMAMKLKAQGKLLGLFPLCDIYTYLFLGPNDREPMTALKACYQISLSSWDLRMVSL